MKFYAQGEEKGTLIAKFTLDTSINADTIIYFNEDFFYSNGFKLTIEIDGKV